MRFGIGSNIVPMSDSPVTTQVVTPAGVLPFQDYFVRRRAEPVVTSLRYDGTAQAGVAPAALAALADPRLCAIVIAPSNPWLSIEPMLAIPALRAALDATRVPVVAVSPIVGGAAIKGPTAKIMAELGLPVSAVAIARHYRDLIDGFILDATDAAGVQAVEEMGVKAATTATVMQSLGDKVALAEFTLRFALGK